MLIKQDFDIDKHKSKSIWNTGNCIAGVMLDILASSAEDREFENWLGKTKDFKYGICCFSAKHVALRKINKGWLAWN